MARISFLAISLAAKCRLLFGLAVLLIVSATLFVPWLRMRDLVHENHIQQTRLIGRMALVRSDLGAGNWDQKRMVLESWWASASVRLGLSGPAPRLIQLSDPVDPIAPDHEEDYVKQAIEILAADPSLTESSALTQVNNGIQIYQMVFPVRSTGGKNPPGSLLGVVVVEYAAPRARMAFLINLGLSLMAGALAGILAILVFYLITHKLILSPVRSLTKVAENVSQGKHGVRSNIATGDEFEELSRAFNAMLSHLQASENELRRINTSLDVKMAELAERNVALYEADKIKSQFMSNVSHELRTPLASIIGFAELLREAASAEGGRKLRYTENIMSSGRMLLGLINDLLDLAKIEAGKLELHPAPVNMPDMLRNLMDLMRPLADKKSLQLVASIPEVCPTILSDTGRIQQILYNLLSNAVKFTPEGGLVEMKLTTTDDDHLRIQVRDTGIGIPEEELSGVFEKFRQLDGSMTREHSGTGLGLAISRELVDRLGGSLQVESEVGEGSVFTVILPPSLPEENETTAQRKIDLTEGAI